MQKLYFYCKIIGVQIYIYIFCCYQQTYSMFLIKRNIYDRYVYNSPFLFQYEIIRLKL